MKSIRSLKSVRVLLLAVLAVGVLGSVIARSQQADEPTPSVVGTWRVNVYGGGDFNFVGVCIWHLDGTFTEQDTSTPASQQTIGQGVYERTGNNSYPTYFEDLEWDSSGNPIGRSRVSGTVTVSSDGETMRMVGAWDVIDNEGNVIPGTYDTFTATGTRMHVQTVPAND